MKNKKERLTEINGQFAELIRDLYPSGVKLTACGEGNPDAGIAVLLAAPDIAGKSLRAEPNAHDGEAAELSRLIGVRPDDIYITYAIKVHSFAGADNMPDPFSDCNKEDAELSRPFLLRELDTLEPDLIVVIGAPALKILLDRDYLPANCFGRRVYSDLFRKSVIFPLRGPNRIENTHLSEHFYEDMFILNRQLGSFYHK